MRIDHIAYRVANRESAAKFLTEAFGYKIEDEFSIDFDDGTSAICYALTSCEIKDSSNVVKSMCIYNDDVYYPPPQIFVSEGTEGSIVGDWVKERGGIGGVHHIAYETDDVASVMKEWKDSDWAEFTTEEPIRSQGLEQCFTKPHPITGVIYEFISRTTKGFNIDNVRDLMKSTKNI